MLPLPPPLSVSLVAAQDPAPDRYYDHIVPLWGACTQSTAPTNVLNNATDKFSMTTDLKVCVCVCMCSAGAGCPLQ